MQGHLTSKVISVNFASCGKNLHSLLNSPQLGPELHNAIPTPTWLLQTDIHSFPGIEPIKAQLSFMGLKTKQEIIMITDTHMSYSDLDISEKTKKIQNFTEIRVKLQ